jgi:hypothetical protein
MKQDDNLTLQDVQFLFLRLLFWVVVLGLIFFIHQDAKKENEIKEIKKENQCLTIPSN